MHVQLKFDELKDAVANAQHARDTARSGLERTKRDCKESLEILTKERDQRVKMLKEEEKVLAFFKEQNQNSSSNSSVSVLNEEENNDDTSSSRSQLRRVVTHHNAHEEAMRQIFALTGLTKEQDIIRTHQERQTRLEEIERHVQDLKQEMKDLTEDNDKISSPISSPSRDTKEEERVGEA